MLFEICVTEFAFCAVVIWVVWADYVSDQLYLIVYIKYID